jgi:glycosyltransferase involved in cell wall biosynthesis
MSTRFGSAMNGLHVAIVDEELPYPLNSGKRIRTFQLVSRLARRHRITYLCHRNADRQEAAQAEPIFRDHGIQTVVVERPPLPKSGPGFYARLAANLLSPFPYSVASHTSAPLRRAIRSFAARQKVDLWQAEWTPYAASLQIPGDVRRVIMAHNVESQIWRRYHENETNPLKRWYIGIQMQKYERFERRVFQQVERIVAVSIEDKALIRDGFGAGHVEVVENGVDTSYFRPVTTKRIPSLILFLGSLDWRPNLDAVEQLLSVIFPAVRAEDPSARLSLVGRNPPAFLRQRVAETPAVELHADVPDVRPFLAQAAIMVVPLRIGGGSRLKILEAMAGGTPVISTRVGAEGLGVRDGKHLVVVETCEEMAGAILDHERDVVAIARMTGQARQLVEDRYDWDILADHLNAIWSDAVSHAPREAVRLESSRRANR